MAINELKKKKIIDLVDKTLTFLDTDGTNRKHYKEMLSKMSLPQLEKYIKSLKDPDTNFYLEIIPNKNEPSLDSIKKCLDFLNVPVEEYVYMKDNGNSENPIRTKDKVMVGYLYIRKMQQFLSKKNAFTLDITSRNQKLNQVTGGDKAASLSDSEVVSLLTVNAENILKELLGPRADNRLKKQEMYSDIEDKGSVSLADLQGNLEESQTINTVDVYFLGAGLKTDLLSIDDTLPKLNNK